MLRKCQVDSITVATDYGRPVKKSPSLHGRKSTPTLKFLGATKAYLVCHISTNFLITLIYAFIWCPWSVLLTIEQVNHVLWNYSHFFLVNTFYHKLD